MVGNTIKSFMRFELLTNNRDFEEFLQNSDIKPLKLNVCIRVFNIFKLH